jgi:hypothetical protein
VDYGHLIAWPILGGAFGIFAFLPVFIVLPFTPFALDNPYQSGSNGLFIGLVKTGAIIGFFIGALTVAFQLSEISRAKQDYRRRKAAYDAALADQEREKERQRARYISAYGEYLPKWQAWQKSMEVPTRKAAERRAWQAMVPEYERRAKQAAAALDRLFHTIDTRARRQLGVHNPTDIHSLFREAVSAASQTHPDLGLLRLPPWRGLVTLAPLDHVFSALPRVPSDVLQEVTAPVFPQRPIPPSILVFPSDYEAPLPVERVRFS